MTASGALDESRQRVSMPLRLPCAFLLRLHPDAIAPGPRLLLLPLLGLAVDHHVGLASLGRVLDSCRLRVLFGDELGHLGHVGRFEGDGRRGSSDGHGGGVWSERWVDEWCGRSQAAKARGRVRRVSPSQREKASG